MPLRLEWSHSSFFYAHADDATLTRQVRSPNTHIIGTPDDINLIANLSEQPPMQRFRLQIKDHTPKAHQFTLDIAKHDKCDHKLRIPRKDSWDRSPKSMQNSQSRHYAAKYNSTPSQDTKIHTLLWADRREESSARPPRGLVLDDPQYDCHVVGIPWAAARARTHAPTEP